MNLFTDEEVEETFYFHLSAAEIAELELSVDGGLSEMLKKIVEAEDNKNILTEFKNIILTAYGVRSENGKFFKKNQEVREEFASSEAYSVLFMELLSDEDAAAEFVNGIVPKDLAQQAAKMAQSQLTPVPDEPEDEPQEVRAIIVSDDEQGRGGNNPAN
jgi:phage-related baseplate assembly protein